jgi:hypothetical protein
MGVSIEQSLFEGLVTFGVVSGLSKLCPNPGEIPILVPGGSGAGGAGGMLSYEKDKSSKAESRDGGGGARSPQGSDFPDLTFHQSSGKLSITETSYYQQSMYPSIISDRSIENSVIGNTFASKFGGIYHSGASTYTYGKIFGIVDSSSPTITPEELTGRTPSEIRKMANDKGLRPSGDVLNPNYPRKWKDPISNQERLRIDPGHIDKRGMSYRIPEAAKPHVHGYNEVGIHIKDAFGNSHFPLVAEVKAFFVSAVGRIFVGLSLLLYSPEIY